MENKGLVLAACIALTAPNIAAAETFSGVAALNLGDIDSKSYLDEHFKGSIPILYTSAEEAFQLKVRLASNTIFSELGVEKFPILNSFSFKIKLDSNNKPYVAIQSTQAIDLPFLSFVIEIYGAEGSIYQDYTVLLDPRSYASNTISNAASVATSTNKVSTTSANKIRPKRVRVKAGNSLSGIADSVKLPNISNKRMARAIFLKNPRAFSGNNVNKLKKGVTLKIPSLKELENVKHTVKNTTQKKISKVKPATIEKPTPAVDEGILTYKVKSGDTLSGISRKYASKTASFSKMMTAIHAENPQAFTNNKASLLKKGAVLSIPSDMHLAADKPLVEDNIQSFEKNEKIAKKQSKKNRQKAELNNTYKVIQGDTLGTIVKRLGFTRSETAKAMKSIFRKNKKAFNNKDITSLKTGATLHLLKKGDAKKLIETQRKPKKATTTIENTINFSLNSLEKRLRELRKDLKSSQSKLYDLKLTLKNKDALLDRQSKDIIILKKKLADIKSVAKNKIDKATESETSSKSILETESTLENNKAGKETSTAEIITYSGLALLIGLMLLRVGRQKYAERMVAADDYVPTAKIEPLIAQEKLDFKNTLLDSEKEKAEINEASIQECERLVEELVDELDYKLASTHHDNQTTNKTGNKFVKTLQEEHQKVIHNNDLTEDSDYEQTEKNIEESGALKADILSILEETVEEKLKPESINPKEADSKKSDSMETLEIDLERHLQSINDQIVANKMKDLI